MRRDLGFHARPRCPIRGRPSDNLSLVMAKEFYADCFRGVVGGKFSLALRVCLTKLWGPIPRLVPFSSAVRAVAQPMSSDRSTERLDWRADFIDVANPAPSPRDLPFLRLFSSSTPSSLSTLALAAGLETWKGFQQF